MLDMFAFALPQFGFQGLRGWPKRLHFRDGHACEIHDELFVACADSEDHLPCSVQGQLLHTFQGRPLQKFLTDMDEVGCVCRADDSFGLCLVCVSGGRQNNSARRLANLFPR